MTAHLAFALRSLTSAVDSLVVVAGVLDAEVPAYSVGGLGLAVASIGEQVTNRGLEVHAAARALRPDSHRAAGLADPKILAYVHALISTGRVPGAEAGRWG